MLASYDAVVGRDVTLDKLPAQRMRIANGDYVDSINKAYYAFTDKHPEYMISISTTLDTDSLLQSMMNRDSSVDIYTLPSTSSAFTSLMNRGFMAELEGNQTISDAVNAMYGFIKDYVMKDGHIYALPLSCYANMMSLNTKQLSRKAGLRGADLVEGAADDSGRYFKQQAARGDAGGDDRRTGLRQG